MGRLSKRALSFMAKVALFPFILLFAAMMLPVGVIVLAVGWVVDLVDGWTGS